MCRNSELEPLRQNLRNNLWRMVNGKSIQVFPFMEYLIDILINRHKKITITSTKFLKIYRDMLKSEYASVLDYIQSNIINGDIIYLEWFIRNKINGNITQILDIFIERYEESKKNCQHN